MATIKKEVVTDRDARWKKFLDEYKAQNPVRFARLEEAGEFKTIPETFR